jgi:DNA-binding IclR family transcriptional regulator
VVKRDGRYHVRLRFLGHGDHARERYRLYHVAKPEIQKLAEETGELVNLLVEENGWGYYIYQVYGENAVNVAASTGHRVTLHNTALGKPILAHLPADRRKGIIDEYGFTATTENTITDRETLNRSSKPSSSAGSHSTAKSTSRASDVLPFPS